MENGKDHDAFIVDAIPVDVNGCWQGVRAIEKSLSFLSDCSSQAPRQRGLRRAVGNNRIRGSGDF